MLITAPLLPLAEFKALVNHHLNTTEWRYATNQNTGAGPMDPLDGGHWQMDNHPIQILGSSWPEGQR